MIKYDWSAYSRSWRERQKQLTGSGKDSNFTERHRLYMQEYRKKESRDKQRARAAVKRAIACGVLKRQVCEKCGATAQAHHRDYSKPLEVQWLCPQHHKGMHIKGIL